MNKADLFIITFATTLLSLLICVYYKLNSIVVATVTALTLVSTLFFLIAVRNIRKRASYREFILYYTVVGQSAFESVVETVLDDVFDDFKEYADKNRILLCCYQKDGTVSKSELCSRINEAYLKEKRELLFVCERLPADSSGICKAFSMKLSFISLKRIYRGLKKADMLPAIDTSRRFSRFSSPVNGLERRGITGAKITKIRSELKSDLKGTLQSISDLLFDKRNARRYLLSASVIGIFYFFTPFKVYYLILCAVLLSFTVISIIKNAIY